jgi:type IV pilus assembly protein PilX
MRTPAAPRARQGGAILVIALMFLVLLTMLAMSSMSGTTLEERMSGQYRDLNVAFQAAETALRDAERDMWGIGQAGAAPRNPPISGAAGFGDTGAGAGSCSDDTKSGYGRGLCVPLAVGPTPAFPSASLAATSTVAVPYGRYTNATALANVSAQPVYLIEALCAGITPPAGTSLGNSTGAPTCYHRITSRGFGANANTAVTLQEVYLKPPM